MALPTIDATFLDEQLKKAMRTIMAACTSGLELAQGHAHDMGPFTKNGEVLIAACKTCGERVIVTDEGQVSGVATEYDCQTEW